MDTQKLYDELTKLTPSEIFETACQAGKNAAVAANAKLPPEGARGFDCGFAWVIVKPAKGPFVAWCKANGKGKKGYNGGWQFWYSLFSVGTQSVSVHVEAAEAFAAVLRKYGIEAVTDSRLD